MGDRWGQAPPHGTMTNLGQARALSLGPHSGELTWLPAGRS